MEMDRILYDELLEEVLRRLPPPSTFSSHTADVSLVSKRWLRLYRSTISTLSLGLFIGDWNFDDAELKLETLYLSGIRRDHRGFNWLWKSCKNLKKLQLHCCEGIGDDMLVSSFVNCLQGLQDLELKVCGYFVWEVLSRLVENCKSLNSLSLSGSDGSGEALLQFITRSCCNLRQLDLSIPSDLKDNHLLAIAEKFRGLSSLQLNSCFCVTGEGLKTMALAMSNELEELALNNCEVVGREHGLLTSLGQSLINLRKLDLSYNKMVDKEFISMLAWCNGLRELKVRGCRRLTKASVVSMFKSCKELESVDIMDCGGIEAEAVELFVLNCLQLRQIHVEKSKLSDVSGSWASKKFVAVLGY
ncbi:hypothetical protein RHMOL_Rhmol08G0057500 [Rhododendron molle]|uniref:Uncharacterized protein n=1 Tax=Rhododendron molle TaxID=49168 RepID=A0ACC0MK96_RHOML|nr:hypothetical protein RHMOL_Rhmol08G0057500 [Rhododendron molle]